MPFDGKIKIQTKILKTLIDLIMKESHTFCSKRCQS